MNTHQLVLASESIRRANLLSDLGFRFTIHPSKISESLRKNLNIEAQILDVSERKLLSVLPDLRLAKNPPFVVLTADTMVVFEEEALGKPASPEEAIETLGRLSGNSHQVITAVSVWSTTKDQVVSIPTRTEVKFRKLSNKEIQTYVQSGDPLDKAGSYGIQGAARAFVEKIEGSFTNVMGLPTELIIQLFQKKEYLILKDQK